MFATPGAELLEAFVECETELRFFWVGGDVGAEGVVLGCERVDCGEEGAVGAWHVVSHLLCAVSSKTHADERAPRVYLSTHTKQSPINMLNP